MIVWNLGKQQIWSKKQCSLTIQINLSGTLVWYGNADTPMFFFTGDAKKPL